MAGRRAKRFSPNRIISVGFQGIDLRFTGQLVDLSTTGVLVRCRHELKPGTMGKLAIQAGHDTVRVVGIVRRWVEGVGVAFEFSNMTPRDRELLHRVIVLLSGNLAPSAADDPAT